MPKKKKPAAHGAVAAAAGGKLYDCGAPYGKVTGYNSDPHNALHIYFDMSGTFWPSHNEADRAKSWRVCVEAYVSQFPFPNGAAPAYLVTQGGYPYPYPASKLLKLLPKGAFTDGLDSEDETPGGQEGNDDPAQEEEPKKTRSKSSKKTEIEYDDSRPGAEIADEVNELVTKLHGEKGGTGDDLELLGAKKKVAKYKVAPTGWMCLAAKVKAALLGVCFSGVKDGAADLAFTGPKLRNPVAQGITRNTASTWRLVDSFNLVFPVVSREEYAAQTTDYRDYQLELGEEGNIAKTYEYLWPEGGLTRAHYDAYIATVAAMGLVRLPNIYNYWSTNGDRFLVPFVRRTLTRDMFMMIRHYLHFADARKKVMRGDRSKPAPPGYDPIYNFRPVMDSFNAAWSSLATLSEYLTIDEKMIKLAMHIGLSRRQPNKPIRDGLQVGIHPEPEPEPEPYPRAPPSPPSPYATGVRARFRQG